MGGFEIRGIRVPTSGRGNVTEGEDPLTGIHYALFTSADAFIREVVGMYAGGIQELIDDPDATLFIYYEDGHHWSSNDGTKEGYYRKRIYSAVYQSGWFGEYAYNCHVEEIDMGPYDPTLLTFEPKDPREGRSAVQTHLEV